MKKRMHFFIPFFSVPIGIVLWETIIQRTHIEPWILPAPSQILTTLFETRALLFQHALVTIVESVIGLIVAIIFALIAATLMYSFDVVKKALYPILVISQTIPIIALAPLFIIWFGFGLLPKVLVVALVCFFPITVNLIDGFALLDKTILQHLQIMGATKRQILQKAVLPASMPFFFSGLRIAGSYTVLTAVVAEWLGAQSGLGVFMIRASKSYATDRVFAIIVIISMISLLIVAIIDCIYFYVVPWKRVTN